MPKEARVARHSRLTAACLSSPGFGKYQARRQSATGSKAAPCAAAQGSIGVLRVTSKVAPWW